LRGGGCAGRQVVAWCGSTDKELGALRSSGEDPRAQKSEALGVVVRHFEVEAGGETDNDSKDRAGVLAAALSPHHDKPEVLPRDVRDAPRPCA